MNGLRMYHLYPFFKEKKKEETPMRKEWISRIMEIGALKAKITHNYFVWGGGSTRTRQKWAQNAPFESVLQKFSRGDPDPPPLLREDFGFSSTAKVKIFPHHVHVYRRSEIWKQKLHTIFGEKIDTNSAKMGYECTICIRFFKNFLGETPTPPPTARR